MYSIQKKIDDDTWVILSKYSYIETFVETELCPYSTFFYLKEKSYDNEIEIAAEYENTIESILSEIQHNRFAAKRKGKNKFYYVDKDTNIIYLIKEE